MKNHTINFKITDKHWWKMVDAGMSKPVPLQEADLSKPFIYQRGFGVSYVRGGYHQSAMTLLYTFHKGCIRQSEMLRNENFDPFDELQQAADAWSILPGTAWKSSVGKRIEFNNISLFERKYFDV